MREKKKVPLKSIFLGVIILLVIGVSTYYVTQHSSFKDKTKEETYKIYVTKTTNVELANANLEILAVREGFLNPEFDYNIKNYKVEIPNNT